jgi:hypothetical protein
MHSSKGSYIAIASVKVGMPSEEHGRGLGVWEKLKVLEVALWKGL